MEEMELKLTNPIESLIPKSIDWNGEELLALVDKQLEPYRGVTFTDDQMAQAKAIRAKLSKFCDVLNGERIRIGREYNAPYEVFKGQVDRVIAKVKEANTNIDAQIKESEERKRQEKLAEITALYEETIGELKDIVPLERILDQKWLNATVTMKKVTEELKAKIDTIRNSLVTIEALHSPDETALKAFFFRTLDLASALMENERLKQDRARVEALQKQQAAQNPTDEAKPQDSGLQASIEANEINSSIPTMTVRFEVTGTVEEMKGLREYLQTHHIYYKAI